MVKQIIYRKLLIEKFEEGKFIDRFGTITWVNKNGQLHREGDKPAVIWSNGDKDWYKNGQFHRDGDKPAIIYSNGDKSWYKNGQPHRDENKPAIILLNGDKSWYKNGKFIK